MRTLPVRFAPEAEAQVQAIEDYVANQGRPEIAAAYTQDILERCHKIGQVPFGGRPRDDLLPGARTVPFKGVTIIYTVEDDMIVIQGVFYRGRDIDGYFA